ncbi:unnamed protein product [Cylindrotheca closterium]|uniref:Circumsporozoite protein n=1 Tax=Cylindrotheca closterium TaxID=2856 RepID=A0AAD2G908_9STRA|nr:unnamed protein product [Cylindrotheca closterium]
MYILNRKFVLGAFLLTAVTSASANEVASEVERDLISFQAFDQLLQQDPPPTDPPTRSPVDDNGEGVPRTPPPSPPPTVTPTGSRAPSISNAPTSTPSKDPSSQPSGAPSGMPTATPSSSPSKVPSTSPSNSPSSTPSNEPSGMPSSSPSHEPTGSPSMSSRPSIRGPTASPSSTPSSNPSSNPSSAPSGAPSASPSRNPTSTPSGAPTGAPSVAPSNMPSSVPSSEPSSNPSSSPSRAPSPLPSSGPSKNPSSSPSRMPTGLPSINPTGFPSIPPSRNPTNNPTPNPTPFPTRRPTPAPTFAPTSCPNPTACLRFQDQGNTGFFALERCAASCDFDIQCKQGLVCYKRSRGQRNVPGCIGNADEVGVGDWNYCVTPPSNQLVLLGNLRQPASAYPLRRCAGDCDNDGDCAAGLFCFERNGGENVPGCIGGGQPGFDYCYNPGSGFERLIVYPQQEFDYYELFQCEGDCDFDSDCAIGFICFEREGGGSGSVPRCVGNANVIGFGNDDFCIPRPRTDTLMSVYENEVGGDVAGGGVYPIPRCAGDCDVDADCQGALTCFQRAGFTAVPGCTGTGEEDYDYCI